MTLYSTGAHTLHIRIQGHIENTPQHAVCGSIGACNKEVSNDVEEIVLREQALFWIIALLLGQHLHQIHVYEIPGILRIQRGPVPHDDLLQEGRDADFRAPQLFENAAGQVVEPGKDINQ